jgi:hypothetical protein
MAKCGRCCRLILADVQLSASTVHRTPDMRRLERAAEPFAVRYIICPFPYDEDNPPSLEVVEAVLNAPPITDEEWEATFCTPDGRLAMPAVRGIEARLCWLEAKCRRFAITVSFRSL